MKNVVVTAPDGADPANFAIAAGSEVVITVTVDNANAGTYINHVEISQPKYDPDHENAAEKIAECDSASVIVSDPVAPDDPIDPDKPILNKKDHVAYIIGYPDDTVRPNNDITRAEVVTIFFRLFTDESRAAFWSQTNDYSDVSASDWYNNAISTLTNAGIIYGYPDGTFRPDAPITRAEFAAIATRFSEVTCSIDNSFTDVPDNYWYARSISLAEQLGWINGYPDRTFKPDQPITRAESMTLINRVLERGVEKDHMLPDMIKWPDNLYGDWYYEAVQEATNSHEYVHLSEPFPDQNFFCEEWLKILDIPDWAALEKNLLQSAEGNANGQDIFSLRLFD